MTSLTLKVKTNDDEYIVNDLTTAATVDELKRKLTSLSKIGSDRLSVLTGFPPKKLDLSDELQTLSALGINNFDRLIVNDVPATTPKSSAVSTPVHEPRKRPAESVSAISGPSDGILLKMVVPSDNSCLFTSIAYLLNGSVDTDAGSYMRQMIATNVASNTETYNAAFLGKSNQEYCDWIQKSESWGGAIEVALLAESYGIELAVVDIINGIIIQFAEDKEYGCRGFLLYDGIHYDPLYVEYMDGERRTLFERDNEAVLLQARQLAEEAKSSRQYTDVNKFTLICRDCDASLIGQAQAQEHAKKTGHTNFSEL